MLLNQQRIEIMQMFTRDYFLEITASSLALRKKLNQKTVANTLNQLEEEGFLRTRTEGKNKLYCLNMEDKLRIVYFLSLFEHTKTLSFFKKNKHIKEISDKILPFCEGIVLIFGSYAKHLQKENSDLDIFIVGTYNNDQIKDISNIYKIEINIKKYSLPIFRKAIRNDLFLNEIKKDHILIKNIDLFVRELLYAKNYSTP